MEAGLHDILWLPCLQDGPHETGVARVESIAGLKGLQVIETKMGEKEDRSMSIQIVVGDQAS